MKFRLFVLKKSRLDEVLLKFLSAHMLRLLLILLKLLLHLIEVLVYLRQLLVLGQRSPLSLNILSKCLGRREVRSRRDNRNSVNLVQLGICTSSLLAITVSQSQSYRKLEVALSPKLPELSLHSPNSLEAFWRWRETRFLELFFPEKVRFWLAGLPAWGKNLNWVMFGDTFSSSQTLPTVLSTPWNCDLFMML